MPPTNRPAERGGGCYGRPDVLAICGLGLLAAWPDGAGSAAT